MAKKTKAKKKALTGKALARAAANALKQLAPQVPQVEVAQPGRLALLEDGSKPLVLGHAKRPDDDPQEVKARKLAELRQTEALEAEQERIAARVDVDLLTKDQLIVHARRSFGIALNEKETVGELRTTVKRLTGRETVASRNVRPGAHE